jgi:hypothetical protein
MVLKRTNECGSLELKSFTICYFPPSAELSCPGIRMMRHGREQNVYKSQPALDFRFSYLSHHQFLHSSIPKTYKTILSSQPKSINQTSFHLSIPRHSIPTDSLPQCSPSIFSSFSPRPLPPSRPSATALSQHIRSPVAPEALTNARPARSASKMSALPRTSRSTCASPTSAAPSPDLANRATAIPAIRGATRPVAALTASSTRFAWLGTCSDRP